jgi:hypothetical protein
LDNHGWKSNELHFSPIKSGYEMILLDEGMADICAFTQKGCLQLEQYGLRKPA